jgi:hypothetical protein
LAHYEYSQLQGVQSNWLEYHAWIVGDLERERSMIFLLWLLSLLNPYQFTVPQHTGAVGGAAPGFSIANSASCQAITQAVGCTTGSISVTAGHTLVMYVWSCYYSSATCNGNPANFSNATFSDSNGGNTWETQSSTYITNAIAGGYANEMAVVCDAVGASYTFTGGMDLTFNEDFVTVLVMELAGTSTATGTGCIDTASGSAAQNTASANPSVTSGTVGFGGDLMVGAVGDGSAITGTGQTSIVTAYTGFNAEWTTGPSSGTQAMTWTAASGQWTAAVIGIKHP